MKGKLNLTIEENVLKSVKTYARMRKISISDLVEKYFQEIVKQKNQANIIEEIEKLDKPDIPEKADLKKQFYENKKGKYGF